MRDGLPLPLPPTATATAPATAATATTAATTSTTATTASTITDVARVPPGLYNELLLKSGQDATGQKVSTNLQNAFMYVASVLWLLLYPYSY